MSTYLFHDTMILGIDEAGKGPVIGSMIVAGICATPSEMLFLKTLGIRDSKKLSPNKRNLLYQKIIGHVSNYYILEIKAHIIDELRKIMTMNEIMVYCFSKVITKLKCNRPNVIVVDAADVFETRFKSNIINEIGTENMRCFFSNTLFVSRHKADSKYLIVSAASIIAKVERDNMIKKLNIQFNVDVGSGYPSDLKTIDFLNSRAIPFELDRKHIRKSWKTFQRITVD